jgi:hypothetical protein
VILLLFSRALVAVAKNIGIAILKFKSADSQLLKQVETSERAAIVLQSAWRRKQAMFKFKSRQIKARFDRDFKPKYGKSWRRLILDIKVDNDDASITKEEYNTNSGPAGTSVTESDALEPNHRLARKARRARRLAARENVQPFAIHDRAWANAAHAACPSINFREGEKADCFSDLFEEEEFLVLMDDLRAMEII